MVLLHASIDEALGLGKPVLIQSVQCVVVVVILRAGDQLRQGLATIRGHHKTLVETDGPVGPQDRWQ